MSVHSLCPSRYPTFKGISPIVELQLENIVGCSVGVQGRHPGLPSPDETVLSPEDDDWTVDEFHQELLGLGCSEGMKGDSETHTSWDSLPKGVTFDPQASRREGR